MVIMMFRTNVLKEVILPNIDNTDYRIFVDKKLFEVYHSFYINLEVINQKWRINADVKAYRLIHHKQTLDYVEINGGEIVTVRTVDDDIIKCITFDDSISLMPFKKYDIIRCPRITVGKAEGNTIRYEFMNLVSMSHCSIERVSGSHILYNTSKNGVFVNNRRIGSQCELRFGDVIDFFGLRIVYFKEMIAVGSRAANYEASTELKPYVIYISEEQRLIPKHRERFFNRAPRIFPSICTEQIVIEPPTNPQFSKKKSLLLTIGPSFTMAIPMLLGCGMMILSSVFSGGMTSAFMFTGLITACGSAVLGSIWALMNIRNTKRTEIAEETQRFNAYGNYLLEIAEYIKEKYRQNTDALYTLYPSSSQCCQYNETTSELWNRNISHNDFFYYRLGTGDIDFQVDIQIPKEKFTLQFDNLKDKPSMIYENFKVLRNVPVGMDFSEHNIYGIVGGERKRGVYDIVNNIIVQIAASASYADAKIAFCFDARKFDAAKWSYIKWLPHLWSENRKNRYYATDSQEAADVFFELSNIIRQRAENAETGHQKVRFFPHYFLFVSDASLLDGEMIAKYVYNKNANYGLTTFIMADCYQKLPNVCENIIQNDEDFRGCYNALNNSRMSVPMRFDKVSASELEGFAKRLASINVRENEDDASIVSSLDFFEMYGVANPDEFRIAERWRKNRTYNTMRALVGKKAGGADCYLDIHEKYHGPHGLVAGTTGSGKSELVQTYMLSLAINYSPEDVSFFVIDFKGGGMANLFSDLPHLVGTISNLSGNQISRAMISIKSENLRRQKVFGEYGVNNINNYTRLYKSGEAAQPIPHLLIIIDEFAELKKEQPEFMQELISVAQVGRSLGVHLILATQKPSGTVDDNIWSNSKFRLCLRVQDRQDSNDMLHKPDAAYITQAGRCYLQVGNDEIFELFQSGFSGAVYTEGEGKSSAAASMIGRTGKADLVGARKKRSDTANESEKGQSAAAGAPAKKSAVKETTQLDAVIAYLDDLVKRAGYRKSDQLWLPVLPEALYLRSLIEMEEETAPGSADLYFDGESWAASAGETLPEEKTGTSSDTGALRVRRHPGKWHLETIIGLYDDPEQQAQRPLHIDFTDGGHLAVCGQVVSGKSTFLQSLIYGLINRYTPQALQVYLLDFSSNMLGCFADAPHVGGIVTDVQEDRQEKFFHMLSTLMDERRSALQGGNFAQYVQAYGMKLPAVLVVIDNYAGFRTKTNDKYDDVLLRLSREGVGYGIFLVVSAAGFGINDIPSRIGDNLRTIISLEQPDKFKYMEIIRRTHLQIIPETNVKGRGLALVDDRPLEFQTVLCMEAEDDFSRGQKIAAECQQMRDAWKGEPARRIPEIPENPTLGILETDYRYRHALGERTLLPFGYFAQDASIASVDLLRNYCFMITGRARSGKTNMLRLLLHAASKTDADRVIIEKKTSEFTDFEKQAAVYDARYVSDGKEMYTYFSELLPEFARRNKIKRSLIESGMDEMDVAAKMMEEKPIFIFIADMNDFMTMVYKKEAGIGDVSGFLENIMEKGSMHNIFFFACLRVEDDMGLRGYRAYNHYCSYKKGVHLGGNLQGQKIFNFQNIPFNQSSKTLKKGFGHMSSDEEEGIGIDVVIPLAKI